MKCFPHANIYYYFISGVDPVAVLRWTILKTLIKSMFAFIRAGKTYRHRGGMAYNNDITIFAALF
jgi:hypothetical protein